MNRFVPNMKLPSITRLGTRMKAEHISVIKSAFWRAIKM